MINKEIVLLLEGEIYKKLLEIIVFENELCPLNHPEFMTETERNKHNKLTEEFNKLKTEYSDKYDKLDANQLPFVNFDNLLESKRSKIRGLIPLSTGDEFDNNVRLCYERVYNYGKNAIEWLVEAKKNKNSDANQNVKNLRIYYLCMGLCDGYYMGEKIKFYLLDYEKRLRNGTSIFEDKVEYQENINAAKEILLELAQLRFDGTAFVGKGNQKIATEYYRELEEKCSSLISRCDILASVMPLGTYEATDLYSLRVSMYANPRAFIETVNQEKEKQKIIE